MLGDQLGDVEDRDVLEAGIVDAGVLGMIEQEQIEVGDVVDVDVGPGLVAAEHGDAAVHQRLHGQHVDGDIEPLPRRIAADRGGPHDLHHHVVLVGQHDALAAHLGLVVFGDRQQFEIFGDLLLVLDAVDAARRRIDEALDAVALGPVGELHGGKAADFPGQLGIEIAAGIVGDAREMDDGVDAGQVDLVGVADVALDDSRSGCGRRKLPNHMMSNATTLWPRSSSFGTSTLPLYPHAPVTKTCIDADRCSCPRVLSPRSGRPAPPRRFGASCAT